MPMGFIIIGICGGTMPRAFLFTMPFPTPMFIAAKVIEDLI